MFNIYSVNVGMKAYRASPKIMSIEAFCKKASGVLHWEIRPIASRREEHGGLTKQALCRLLSRQSVAS